MVLPLTNAHAADLLCILTSQVSATQRQAFQGDRTTQAAIMVLALALAPQATGGWHEPTAGLQQAAFLVDWTCRWAPTPCHKPIVHVGKVPVLADLLADCEACAHHMSSFIWILSS